MSGDCTHDKPGTCTCLNCGKNVGFESILYTMNMNKTSPYKVRPPKDIPNMGKKHNQRSTIYRPT